MNRLSLVVSVYNEEESLECFRKTTLPILMAMSEREKPWDYELIYVNDGSTDRSREILKKFAEENRKCKAIHFTRNFGHEAAMIAGIDAAEGDFIICMDADLQNPPELLPDILTAWEQGNDIVLMARTENKDSGVLKRMLTGAFYGILNFLSGVRFEHNVSDFFGISKRAADILRENYREKNRYLRGYVQQLGFSKKTISYIAPERFAGTSKYSMRSLMKIAMNTLNCFSVTPMRAGVIASIISILMTLTSFTYYIAFYVENGYGSGTALLCSMITFLFSILFVLLGVIGEYLGMLMKELKNRPIYIIESTVNIREKQKQE